jgi:tetratricopeptide (TPR) repeat protein
MSLRLKQIIVVSGALILIVLLLFANTKPPLKKEEAKSSEHSAPNSEGLSSLVENAKLVLTSAQKQTILKMEDAIKASTDKKSAYEKIITFADSLKQPILSSYYMERAAIASPVENNWNEAGNRYYASTRFAKEADKAVLYAKARECFEKTVELNPKNTDAKINIAACYVEGSSEPMKGITMLREIEKTADSNNINLQLNFAFFSEKSGQWDRAIKRFEKVLKIKPDFIEAYLHLADAYEQKGDKAKAIESLETYMSKTDDVTAKTEIQEYINKLKTN